MHQHDRSSVIARLFEQSLCLLKVRREESIHPFLGCQRRSANEDCFTGLIVIGITDRRLWEVLLVERVPERLPHFWVVEGIMQMVGTEHVLQTEWIQDPEFYIGIGP